MMPGRTAQSVARLTRESEVPGSIPAPSTHLRFLFRSFKKGSCCHLLAKIYVFSNRLRDLSLPRNSVVRLTDRPDMTIAV